MPLPRAVVELVGNEGAVGLVHPAHVLTSLFVTSMLAGVAKIVAITSTVKLTQSRSVAAESQQSLKPLLRWAGSKRRLLPLLKERLPKSFDRYVEPFCGSAALFFDIRPTKALLSDINSELINFYQQLQQGVDLCSLLACKPRTADSYYEARQESPLRLSRVERAVRFLYLNRLCFNGVYRTNSAGEFNVPMGTRTGGYPPAGGFFAAYQAVRTTEFLVSDYLGALERVSVGDFVYLDPPYFKTDRKRGEYGPGAFDSSSLESLVNELIRMNGMGVQFLLSYRAEPKLLDRLDRRFLVEVIDAKRHVSGFRAGWSVESEVLVRNYE